MQTWTPLTMPTSGVTEVNHEPMTCEGCGARAVVEAVHRNKAGILVWSVVACRTCATPYLPGATQTTWLYAVPTPGDLVVVAGRLCLVTHAAHYRDISTGEDEGSLLDHLIQVVAADGSVPSVGDNPFGVLNQDEYRPTSTADLQAADPADLARLRELGARIPEGVTGRG